MPDIMTKLSIASTILALGCLLSFSCTPEKQAIDDEPKDDDNPQEKTDTTVIPETPVDSVDVANTYTVISATTWKEGDKIVVQDHSSVFEVGINPGSISSDGKTASITVEGLNPSGGYDGHYHAMYPAWNWGSVGHGLYYYLYFETSNAPCAIAYNEDKTFTFKGLCSSIEFSVNGDYDSYCFKGAEEEVVENLSFYVKHKYDDGGKYEVRDLAGDITRLEGQLFASGNIIYLLNNSKFSSGYEILLGKNGVFNKKASFPSSVTFENCKSVKIGDITSKLEPYEEPVDTISSGTYQPVMGNYTKMDVSVPELSGLCLSSDKSFLWAVGDEGRLAKISFDGKTTNVWTHDADMEDVTLDPVSGNLYIAIEGAQKIYQVNAPDFNTYKTIFYVQEAVDGDFGNSGLEGITYYKDNKVFIGAQSSATLWLYNLDGTKIWKKRLDQVSSKIEEVGGLCYDPVTDHLWVADSEKHKLFVFNAECTKLVASYSVSYIDNAESVCVDHNNSCVWVGSDQDSPKLYKIAFTNL